MTRKKRKMATEKFDNTRKGVARGVTELRSDGVLERWSIGVMEYWSDGVLEWWSSGGMGIWGVWVSSERIRTVGISS
jgi:hypothetical protein